MRQTILLTPIYSIILITTHKNFSDKYPLKKVQIRPPKDKESEDVTDYKSINTWVTKKVDEAKELRVSRGTPNCPCVICDRDGDSYWNIKKCSNIIIHLCEQHLRLKLRDMYNNRSVCYCPEEGCKKFYNRKINLDESMFTCHVVRIL